MNDEKEKKLKLKKMKIYFLKSKEEFWDENIFNNPNLNNLKL